MYSYECVRDEIHQLSIFSLTIAKASPFTCKKVAVPSIPATATLPNAYTFDTSGGFDQYHLEQQESLIYQHSNEHLYIRQNQVALDT
jgi:hypothetical protein